VSLLEHGVMGTDRVYKIPRPQVGIIPDFYRYGRQYDCIGYLAKYVLLMPDSEIPDREMLNLRIDKQLCAAIGCDLKHLLNLRLDNDDAHDDADRLRILDAFIQEWVRLDWLD